MTDWELMVEQMRNAVQAVENAQQAANHLREERNNHTVHAFREHMLALANNLEALKKILDNENIYAQDEFAELLTQVLHEPHVYRRIPPVPPIAHPKAQDPAG